MRSRLVAVMALAATAAAQAPLRREYIYLNGRVVAIQEPLGVTVTCTPGNAIGPSESATCTAAVSGTTNTAVTWSIDRPVGYGTMTSQGVYTAPTNVTRPSATVKAVLQADATISSTATITTKALFTPANPTVGYGPQAGRTVEVTKNSPWTAVSNATWITITGGGSGTAPGVVTYDVAGNAGAGTRTGTMSIGGGTYTVTQSGSGTTALAPTSAAVGAAGVSNQTIAVTSGGYWQAVVAPSGGGWVTASPASGTGNGTVTYSVAANGGNARTAAITIGNASFDISQSGCSIAASTAPASFGGPGGTGTLTVTSGCATWTATTADGWISLQSPVSGSGNGTVSFSVAPNPAGARAGSISVGGVAVTVSQAAGVAPTVAASCGATAMGPGEARVCSATVTPSAPITWSLVNPAGFGTVNASTGEYTAPASVGSVTAVTVRATSQTTPAGTGDAAITVKPLLIPASESLNSALQDRTIEVTRNGSWTAAANNGWISVVSGPSGSGPGTVTYRVQANPDVGSRNGSLTVAGAAFAVTQSGGGTATLSPAGNSVPAGGGSYSVSVTSGGAWVVTGVPAWITGVTPMSGFGNGTVNYTVTGNGTAAPRSATLQIGNRDFAVTQAACATSMTPLAADFGASGGAGSVTVVSGCTAWTATAPSWIAITNGSGGATAGQTVNYTVSGNAGAVRAGAIVVNEASHTVNQAGCTPTLAPVAATHLGSGGIGSFAISGGCAISAPTVSEAWITITGSTQTAVSYSVASNPGATDRYGSIWVNGAEFRITQLVTETIEIVPAQVTLYPEGRQTFELRKTRLGVVTNVTGEGSWSLSPAVGTMPSAGYYWAPSAGGFTEGQQVVITASYGGQQVAGQVTLRYPPGTSGAQVYPVGQTGMTGFFMLRMPKPPGAYPDRRQWLAFHAATPDGVTDCYFDISLSGSPSATLAGASLWVFPQITRSTVPPVYGNANARCAVDTVTSFFYGPPNGNYWDIELPVKFLPAFAGTKTVWHRSWTEMGPIPDWVTKGTWTVGQ